MKPRRNELQKLVLKRLEAGLPPTSWQQLMLHLQTVTRQLRRRRFSTIWFHGKGIARSIWKTFTVCRLFGVPVQFHITWFIYPAGFLFWLLFDYNRPWKMYSALLMLLVLCNSLLAHEFAHVLTARRFGIGSTRVVIIPPGALADEKHFEAGMELVRLLKKTKREEQAEALSIRLELGRLGGKEDEYNLLQRRCLALRMFLEGQYAQAETAYRHLLERHFEMATNHCHLARVLLMTDRIEEARGEVNQAWEVLNTGPDYVIPRVHFLKTLLQMLVQADWKIPLADLKQVLAEPGKEADWTIQPVLDHFKPRLQSELYAMMTKIVAAICDREKQPELDSFEVWKNIVMESHASVPPDDKAEDSVPF